MKLYTKEMFLIAAKKCEVSMIDSEHIMKYIDEYVTPIELPSDEEIYINANVNSENIEHNLGFIKGIQVMRQLIERNSNGN